MSRPRRQSDRWVTPAVVATGIVCGALVVLGVAGLVALLAVRGVDPAPVLQLAGTAVTAVGSTAAVALQLVGRRTAARTERSTGLLASAVAGQLDDDGRPSGPPRLKVSHVRGELAEFRDDQLVDDDLVDEHTALWPAVPPPVPRARPRHGEARG